MKSRQTPPFADEDATRRSRRTPISTAWAIGLIWSCIAGVAQCRSIGERPIGSLSPRLIANWNNRTTQSRWTRIPPKLLPAARHPPGHPRSGSGRGWCQVTRRRTRGCPPRRRPSPRLPGTRLRVAIPHSTQMPMSARPARKAARESAIRMPGHPLAGRSRLPTALRPAANGCFGGAREMAFPRW